MAITKKHLNKLTEDLTKYDVAKCIEEKLNEDNTRKRVIEPILMSLGYSWDEMETEFDAGRSKSERADIGLKTNGNRVEVLIECKRITEKLTEKHLNQLNAYFVNLPTTKIGILTNGVEWQFYAPSQERDRDLNFEPYFTFNLQNFNDDDVAQLIRYNRSEFDYKKIQEEAFEIHFLRKFENALAEELFQPSDEFIRSVFTRMGGKKINDKMKQTLGELINSKSLQKAIESLIQKEIKTGGVVITTAEELNTYHVVKTLIIQTKGLAKYAQRISYRDQKTSFNVVVDDNIRKTICKIYAEGEKKSIEINGIYYDFDDISSIVNLKRELASAASAYFE